MKEFKIKTSKHKNKYTFTKLFMVIGLVFITSNTFIYNASAQAVVSNVYAEKENDSVVMKRELVNLSKDEKPLYLVVFEKPLKLGSKGSKVKYMQNILQGKGYLNTSTGVYDKATVSAVKQFQKDNSLIVTGIIGKITFNKLSSVK